MNVRPAVGRAAPLDHGLDPDFAAEVLADLYTYRQKRVWLAGLLCLTLGWLGVHRFYLERPGTGVLMMLTGGGFTVLWLVDIFRVGGMVTAHNREQERRRAAGEPPVELAFMPDNAPDVLDQPPPWAPAWRERGRLRAGVRFSGDLLVLLVSGMALGALATEEGGTEAAVAIVALILAIMLGDRAGWLERVPGLRALVRWSHRLRLFYFFNRPGSPPALLLRGALGIMMAPFRRKDRAEVRLYLELGAVFALAFLALDLIEDVAGPLLRQGLSALSPGRLAELWVEEAFLTFFITYAFAAPVGATLTLYLLARPTHTVPRLLGALALLFIAMGVAGRM